MKRRGYQFVILSCLLLLPTSVGASPIPATYTAANFTEAVHDRPQEFTQDAAGNFFGVTATGKAFTQQYVTTSIAVRLQRFTIDEVSFYVSNQGIINASSDIQALSVYLSYFDLTLEDFG